MEAVFQSQKKVYVSVSVHVAYTDESDSCFHDSIPLKLYDIRKEYVFLRVKT